ncbi:MAG: hypothetical protein Q4G51_01750 [Dermatophilus congolensis]|nr:hypothetical protein [Dermatophilus congolensis]
MSGKQRSGKASREFPSLPAAWADDVILELRLRDVSGARISEILTEAEAHVAETGESPQEAFGDPKAYAASFDFAGQSRAPGVGVGWHLAAAAVMLFGSILVNRHLRDFVTGAMSQITVGDVLSAVLVLGLLLTVFRWLRAAMEWPRLMSGLASVAWLAGFVALRVWGGPVLVSVPAVTLIVIGTVAMLAGAVAMTYFTLRDPQDLLTPPTVRDGAAPPLRDPRADRMSLFAIWVLPVFTLVMALFTWFTR